MKKVLFVFCVFLSAFAFSQDSTSLHQTAKSFLRQGDYNNAILVLNKALQSDPDNLEMKKDLAFGYYLHRDFAKALEIAKPLAERRDADVQTFQILGLVYKAIEERKECEKMYKTALKKFPKSGVLYNEYGEMLWTKKDYSEAVKLWEKGIEVEPNFSGNYYNAAKFYYMSLDKVWGVIYGEIFLNLESYSKRTAEIRTIVYDGYKKLFGENDIVKNQNTKNEFVRAFLENMKKNAHVITSGVTPESLSALRTRFILDWYTANSTRFPFRLFDYHLQLLRSGMFDAYNQWIFGIAKDLSAFQTWTTTHTDEYNKFNTFQKNRVFKLPEGQYYQAATLK